MVTSTDPKYLSFQLGHIKRFLKDPVFGFRLCGANQPWHCAALSRRTLPW
jgi:hypothetical protein